MMAAGTGNRAHPLSIRGDDLYETPPEAVYALLKHEQLPQLIWEPACGPGSIVRVLRRAGHEVHATDLVDYGWPGQDCARVDFLMEADTADDAIVTNPPFKLAGEFVEHARRLCPKVIMLLRLAFLESARRKVLFTSGDFARVYVFSKRLPMMHRAGWEGKKANSGMAFAWFVWDRAHRGDPTIKHIDWEPLAAVPAPVRRAGREELLAGRRAALKCGACGEAFTDSYGSEAAGLAPYECQRCGEEQNLTATESQT